MSVLQRPTDLFPNSEVRSSQFLEPQTQEFQKALGVQTQDSVDAINLDLR